MVKTRSHDGDSKGKELDVEDPMESRLSRLEDLFAERIKMMKQFADMVKALAGQQLEELPSSNVLLEEKSKPQFQVISDPFTEPLECASKLKVPASVYDMDSHVKEMEEFPHQSTNGSGKKIAHQLFDQMPSKEKQRKCLKAWRFKFKRKNLTGIMLQMEQYKLMERRRRRYKKFSTNIKDESMRVLIIGNHRRMVRQLHISRVQCKIRMMKDSWNMRRLTLKVMKSHRKHKWKSKKLQMASNFWINHPHKVADLVLRTALTDWRTKNSTPFVMQSIVVQEMVPMQDNETVTKTYLGQAHELQDTTCSITKRLSPPVRCYQNCRRRFCSLTCYSSASSEDWKHKLEIDLCEYKNQILRLSNHDLEMQMLPCLQRFSVVKMGIHVVFCLQELKPIWWVGYNEVVGVTSTKQELSYWSVANHVKRDAQESFGYNLIVAYLENKKTWTKLRVRKHDNLTWKDDASDESRSRSSRCIVKLGDATITCKNLLEKSYDKNLDMVAWRKRPGRSEISNEEDQGNLQPRICKQKQRKCPKSWMFKFKMGYKPAANWSPQMHLWSTSYRVWHRWKARCLYVGMISTMRAWLFGEGGFDIGNEVKEMTRGRHRSKGNQWLR